jgi:hypothetical protein
MMKGTLFMEEGGYQDSLKEENFLIFYATFSFVRGRHSTLSNWVMLHDSACVALYYSIFLVQQLERKLRKETNLLISQG